MSFRAVVGLALLIAILLLSVFQGLRRPASKDTEPASTETRIAVEHPRGAVKETGSPAIAGTSVEANTGELPTGNEKAPEPRIAHPSSLPLHPIAASIIEQLAKETLSDSLDNLWEGRSFDFPPHGGSGAIVMKFPIEPKDGYEWRDYARIWSNRRVLKLLQELSHMPKEEAGELVAAQIERNLDVYADLLDDLEAGRSSPAPGTITTVADPPVLPYTRLSLSALTAIAGVLGLTSAADAVTEVVRLAVAQRDYYYDFASRGLTEDQGWWPLAQYGLYCPAILTTGLVGTGIVDRSSADEIVSPTIYWTETDLTAWNARGTADGFFEAPDYSKGQITVSYAINVDDERFDRLLHAAGLNPPTAAP